MTRIRDKKALYKKRKSQIEELVTEREVLLRTIDLLTRKFEQLKEKIVREQRQFREMSLANCQK